MGFSGSSVSENNKIREHDDRWAFHQQVLWGYNGIYIVWVRAFLGIEDDENHGI